jgi:hypothetical protein
VRTTTHNRQRLEEVKDIAKFPRLDKTLVHEMDKVFSYDIPRLLEKAQARESRASQRYPLGSAPQWQREVRVHTSNSFIHMRAAQDEVLGPEGYY